MKVISKNCSKKPSKSARQKGMANIGLRAYLTAIPKVAIEVIPSGEKQLKGC